MTEPSSPSTEPNVQRSTTAGQMIGGLIVLAVLGVVIFIAILFVVDWWNESSNGFGECKTRTREMLLDPSSARFGAPSKATAVDDDRRVRFSYSVSATNGFGGRIERQFNCIVDDRGAARKISVQ